MIDLLALANGRLPATVVPACRLDGFGVEGFGREQIGALFARFPSSGDAVAAADTTAAAVVGTGVDDWALFADLHEGNIVRLWRLGPAVDLPPPPPAIAVAADDDLHQSRRNVHFDAADHPGLAPGGAATVAAAAEVAACLDVGLNEPALRSRVFVRRAFSDGATHIALLGLSVLANGARRRPLAFNTLALCADGAPPRLIVDRAGLAAAQARTWAPHL